jgi:hypothetical protein
MNGGDMKVRLIEDICGRRFGHLVAKKYLGIRGKGNSRFWRCLCDCGNYSEVCSSNLKSGHTKSCGCKKGGKTHGDILSPEYKSWSGMRNRCLNKNSERYRFYGARGIKICSRWNRYENFLEDMGRKPSSNCSIDRINNNGDYEPNNCRWATPKTQARNTRQTRILKFNGERKSLPEWAEEYGLNPPTLWNRLNLGWTISESLLEPIRGRNI